MLDDGEGEGRLQIVLSHDRPKSEGADREHGQQDKKLHPVDAGTEHSAYAARRAQKATAQPNATAIAGAMMKATI